MTEGSEKKRISFSSWFVARSSPIASAGNPSLKHIKTVEKSYLQIPREFRSFLKDRGMEIVASRVISDVVPPDEGILNRQEKSSDLGMIHINQGGGIYYSEKYNGGKVIIPEYTIGNPSADPVEATKRYHKLSELDPAIWTLADTPSTKVWHEVTHGVDNNVNVANKMSDMPSFRMAYNADMQALGGGTFVVDHMAKPEEVFADLGAARRGEESYRGMMALFPRSAQWMKEFQEGFRKAYRQGGEESVQNFAIDFGYNRQLPPDTPKIAALSASIKLAMDRNDGEEAYRIADRHANKNKFFRRMGQKLGLDNTASPSV